MDSPAVLLFAHGARDARWAEPFERVLVAVRLALPDQAVELAFLELMQPDLLSAAKKLDAAGARAIVVVPLFLGEGAHLRQDLPRLLDGVRAALPHLAISAVAAAGEDGDVLAALVRYCVSAAQVVKQGQP